MKIKAYAKVNLFLDILYKRQDGFHELDMIMQTINLHDDVILSKKDSGITITCLDNNIPTNEENIAYQAAIAFFKETKIKQGVAINIVKRIPIEAGLGGGSSDGAAVLTGLNKLYETNLTTKQLCDMAISVGSDVPFFIKGGTKRAKGRGEVLSPVYALPKTYFVIIKPTINSSTGSAFKLFDQKIKSVNMSHILYGLNNHQVKEVGKHLYNEFEEYLFPLYPVIKQAKDLLLQHNPIGCLMSGSGSSVFAMFEHKKQATIAYEQALENHDNCILCHSHN